MHDLYLVQVKAPAQSMRVWDYYDVLATVPAEKRFGPIESKCPSPGADLTWRRFADR
jgi:branched-chain amino acid transport system substrate-binding protein